MGDLKILKEKAQKYLRTKYPERSELTISDFERIVGGYSYETYVMRLTWRESEGEASEKLVIRMEPEFGCVPPYDIRPQYEVLTKIYDSNIPVAKVLFLETDSSILARPFYVMEFVEGNSLVNDYMLNPELQSGFEKQYMNILAEIHAFDWKDCGFSFIGAPKTDREFAEKEIDRWEWVFESNEYYPMPIMAEVAVWLRNHIPPAERFTLVHGDYHALNFLAHDGRIRAVLDWESVNIGDPVSEIGWACFFTKVFKGFYDEARIVDDYEKTTQTKVDPDSLFFWKVFAHFRLSAVCISAIKAGVKSRDPDMRSSSASLMLLPVYQDDVAKMLGF